MEYETLEEVICSRMSDLVDQMVYHYTNGNEVMAAVVHEQLQDLKSHASDDDYDFFYATDYKHIHDNH